LALGPFRGPDQAVANPLAVGALAGPLLVVRTVAFVVAGLGISVGAWSLAVRFRRAVGMERQQLRWLAVAAVIRRGQATPPRGHTALDAPNPRGDCL
jgi:hypothetical protein